MQEFNLDDFQWLEYHPGLTSHFPEVTINSDSVQFNVATLKKLDSPTSIKLHFDPNGKRIAIQGCKKKDNKTIDFPPERKERSFGVHKQERVQFIRNLMPEWDGNTRYKVRGIYHETENVVVYDLKTATVFEGGIQPGTKR